MISIILGFLVFQGKKRYTNSASLKALALRIVQWKFAVRTIERANFMLDFTLFEEDFQDLTVVQTVSVEAAH